MNKLFRSDPTPPTLSENVQIIIVLESKHKRAMSRYTVEKNPFRQVSSRVFVRVNPLIGGSNTGLVLCDEGVVVVDSSPSPAKSRADREAIRQITKKPFIALVLTHYHSDHWFGAQVFDSEVIASATTAHEMQHQGQRYLDRARQHHRHLKTELDEVVLAYPTRIFEKQMSLPTTPSVEIIQMGGHTPGTSVVFVPEEHVLFGSDLVFHGIHPYTKGANIRRWMNALDEMLRMDIEIIIPGHGGMCGKQEVSEQRQYLKQFLEELARLKRQGHTMEEVVADLSMLNLPDLHRPKRLAGSIRFHWEEM